MGPAQATGLPHNEFSKINVSGSFPLAAIYLHALGSEEAGGSVCLTRNGVGPVVYRRPIIARRPATAIMIHCSWSVQLSDDGALGLLPALSVRHKGRMGWLVKARSE